MVPGETYADFAALRDEVGHNKRPKLKILEETVNKANDVDDATDNVAQGMLNIDQPWATAPCPYLVPVDGTTDHTLVIPGIGGTGLSTELQSTGVGGATAVEGETGAVVLFTNPQEVWNEYSGTGDEWTERRKEACEGTADESGATCVE
ncbi:hypothetical protein PI126_g11476 [Phytophthora idaei]|nr:hypothetical protein PI126_g11476 [Phytophthora idaei]